MTDFDVVPEIVDKKVDYGFDDHGVAGICLTGDWTLFNIKKSNLSKIYFVQINDIIYTYNN